MRLLLLIILANLMLALVGCAPLSPKMQVYQDCLTKHPEPMTGYGLVDHSPNVLGMLVIAGTVSIIGDSDSHKQWNADMQACQQRAQQER